MREPRLCVSRVQLTIGSPMGSSMLLCTLLVKYNGLLGPFRIVHLTKIVKQAAHPNVETDVLPALRKQNGFKDEITFLAGDRAEAVAISCGIGKRTRTTIAATPTPKT